MILRAAQEHIVYLAGDDVVGIFGVNKATGHPEKDFHSFFFF